MIGYICHTWKRHCLCWKHLFKLLIHQYSVFLQSVWSPVTSLDHKLLHCHSLSWMFYQIHVNLSRYRVTRYLCIGTSLFQLIKSKATALSDVASLVYMYNKILTLSVSRYFCCCSSFRVLNSWFAFGLHIIIHVRNREDLCFN